MTDRETLYESLPAVAEPSALYDHDVVLDGTGLFRTVAQAWHGPDGVVEPHCLPGALPLSMFGGGYGTNLPDVVLVRPILLLGRLGDGYSLVLRREDADEDGMLDRIFAGYGRFRTAELIEPVDVRSGDVLVLEDGRAHRVAGDRMLHPLRTGDWPDAADSDPLPLDRYLSERDMDTLPLTVLR